MERGEMSRSDFMQEIAKMTQHIVDSAKGFEHDTIPGDFGELTVPCPKCAGVLRETYKKFQCTQCEFALWKIVAGRQFEASEIEALIRDRTIGPLTGFRNKMGRPFNALIKMNADWTPEFDFGQGTVGEDGVAEEVDFSAQEPLGKCPKCQSTVFEHGLAYVCEKAVGPAKSCDFRSGKVILQQPIERSQMLGLLASGRTALLKEFVSNRTRRKFSAFLVLGADGKVGFEFEKRVPKTKAPAKAKAGVEAAGVASADRVTVVVKAAKTAKAAKEPTAKAIVKRGVKKA
jgi:DNA topoisomerase-3